MRKIFIVLTALVVGGHLAMAVQEPKYEVKETYGDIEIREYGPLVLSETDVEGDFSQAGNEGFRRIADYIFGGNTQKEKISMTAPVLQEQRGSRKKISFVMPEGKNLTNLPNPNDQRVQLKELPSRKMAVLKYSGTWSEERYLERVKELVDFLKGKKLKTKGEPILARYNPPWIPWFLRRNEVMVELE